MTHSFAISATIHNPVLKSLFTLQDTGLVSVNLGSENGGYNHVAVLVTPERWREIVRNVDTRLAQLDTEKLSDHDPYTQGWTGPTNTGPDIDRNDPLGDQRALHTEGGKMRLIKGSGNAAVTIEYVDGSTETWHIPADEAMRAGAWMDEQHGPADESEGVEK